MPDHDPCLNKGKKKSKWKDTRDMEWFLVSKCASCQVISRNHFRKVLQCPFKTPRDRILIKKRVLMFYVCPFVARNGLSSTLFLCELRKRVLNRLVDPVIWGELFSGSFGNYILAFFIFISFIIIVLFFFVLICCVFWLILSAGFRI